MELEGDGDLGGDGDQLKEGLGGLGAVLGLAGDLDDVRVGGSSVDGGISAIDGCSVTVLHSNSFVLKVLNDLVDSFNGPGDAVLGALEAHLVAIHAVPGEAHHHATELLADATEDLATPGHKMLVRDQGHARVRVRDVDRDIRLRLDLVDLQCLTDSARKSVSWMTAGQVMFPSSSTPHMHWYSAPPLPLDTRGTSHLENKVLTLEHTFI